MSFTINALKRNLLFLNVCEGEEGGCGEGSEFNTDNTLTCCSFCGDSLALVCGTESVFGKMIFVEGVYGAVEDGAKYRNGFQRSSDSVVDGGGYGCVSG